VTTAEFVFGQLGAIILALLFLVAEKVRIQRWSFAAVESFRVWGFMAISIFSIWLALGAADMIVRIAIGLLSPVAAALIVNNSYLALHRFVRKSPNL
jgi:hypothetical protein